MWVAEWGDEVQGWESSGGWNHSFCCWYANAQHRMFELSGDSTYWETAVYIGDSLIGLDTDEDGGIMPGWTFPTTNDHSWVSAYMGWMGMERLINGTSSYDLGVESFVSPNPTQTYLAGDPHVVSVEVTNSGWTDMGGRVYVSGLNYHDSADVEIERGQSTVITFATPWVVPDNDNLELSSSLLAVVVADTDNIATNDSLAATFDFRHAVHVFGNVHDANNTGLPAQIEIFHEAYPDSAWVTLQATADGNYATATQALMEGVNRVVVNPAVQYLQAEAQVTILDEESPYELNFSVETTDLALVDDDVNQTYETYLESSLDSFPSLSSRTWNNAAAALENLDGIATVIWMCGDDSSATLTTSDQSLLQQFLTNGGHLILTGQNIIEDETTWPFLNNVLSCSARSGNTNVRTINGIPGNIISDSVALFLVGNNGAHNQTSPASIFALGDAVPFLRYTSGDDEDCGAMGEYGTGRFVFLSFGLEAVSGIFPSTAREDFIARCFGWFGDSLTSLEDPPTVPSEIWLAQNYPNPFNPSTTIRFFAPRGSGQISLSVYNMLGQRVRTLFNGSVSNREMVVTWDGLTDTGAAAASGHYIYRLQAGQTRLTRTLQLIR